MLTGMTVPEQPATRVVGRYEDSARTPNKGNTPMSMIGYFLQITPAQLRSLIDDPSTIESLIYPKDEEAANTIDIDKAWHGIHFMLTGDVWGGDAPACNVVLGGTEIGNDVGNGPARYLDADEARAVAEALRTLPREKFAKKFDAAEMSDKDIYPEIWDEGDDALDYLLSWYEKLRAYYLDAASKGNAMIKYLA